MKDILNREAKSIRYIQEKFESLAESYGYDTVYPSPLEMISTLETKSGEAIRNEIYEFEDKGGRHVGLRFDFTMGLTRHMSQNRSVPLPSKISSFGGVFRYDEPQKNRYRYFHQWDIEIYGKPHVYQDIEIIEFTSRFFESLPLDVTIRINHRRLVESHIRNTFADMKPSGGNNDTIPDMLRALDKTQKKSRNDIISEYDTYDESCVTSILDMAEIRGPPEQIEHKLPHHIKEHPHWTYLKNVTESLNRTGIRNIQVDFGIVRGLDYYTGMVFEVFGQDNVALAGGGRYDSLPGAFGRADVGAAGVAGGIERIMSCMKDIAIPPCDIAMVYTPDTYDTAVYMASIFRQKGLRVHFDVSGKPFKKQMASSKGCRYAVILGPTEIENNTVTLRDMNLRDQRTVPYDDMVQNTNEYIKIMS